MRVRYICLMTSLCLVDMALNGVYIAISGNYGVLIPVLEWNLLLLGVVNALYAAWLITPVLTGARKGASTAQRGIAARRLARLPGRSARWVMLLTAVYIIAVAASGTFTPDQALIAAVPAGTRLLALAWFVFIYGVYYTFFIYFLVDDFAESLREQLFFSRGIEIRPRRGGYKRKLTLTLVVLALAPNIHLMLDLTVLAPIRTAQGISVAQTVFLDLFATLVVFCLALVFITRTLTRPVNALSAAVARIAGGSLEARAPVMSDDEVGVLSASFNRMLEGLRERAFIRETFGKYIPESVAEAIVAGKAPLEPKRATATILFADIADFTRTCELIEPEEVVAMLNAYYAGVVAVIDRHGGVVNQFQGDAMLVTFNVPVADPLHARNAVAAAVEMQALVERETFAGVRLHARIGINTGAVVAGNVGSPGRYNYTVHGDAVNLAARLEQMNKALGTRLLVSQSTVELLGADHGFVPLGEVAIQGKQHKVTVFGLPAASA